MNKKKQAKPDTDNITALEAAAILKVHPGTLANWRCSGVGPEWLRFGNGARGNVRYSRDAIKAFAKTINRKVSRS